MTPLLLLTGFLGSGKTSLLNRLLAEPTFSETAIVINEAGDVGLDHLLLETGADGISLLAGGCLCCRAAGQLAPALAALLRRRGPDRRLPFTRVIVETSGLADPAPILAELLADIVFHRHFALAGVTTVVDARAGLDAIAVHPAAEQQVRLADRLLVTKADLVAADALPRLVARLRDLNTTADINVTAPDTTVAAALWSESFDLSRIPTDLAASPARLQGSDRSIRFPGVLDADALDAWLAATLDLLGPALLRLKGLVAVAGEPAPVVLHAVAGLLHGSRLAAHLTHDGINRMVLIGYEVDPAVLDDRLQCLANLARRREAAVCEESAW